jgi:hypothetical protein
VQGAALRRAPPALRARCHEHSAPTPNAHEATRGWNGYPETRTAVFTLASEIGDVGRFGSPRKLIGYAGLAPKINQSGDRSRTGALSKAGSRTLRWAAVEAAQHAWRPTNPWHQLYTDLAQRAGKNPAKAAVARKILIAAWHVLSRQQPFKPAAPRRPDPARQAPAAFWRPDGPGA